MAVRNLKLSDNVKKGITQILIGLIIAIVAFYSINNLSEFKEYGYVGVFIISFLSAATIFIPAPGWAAVIATSGVLNPYLIGIVAGLGSGIGEIVGYNIGSGTAEILKKEKNGNFQIVKKYGIYGVFILAFIPNPFFDIAGIAAGALKINQIKFLIAVIIGRTLRFILLAHLGAQMLSLI